MLLVDERPCEGASIDVLRPFEAHWTRLVCKGALLRFDCYDFYKLAVTVHPLTEWSLEVPLSSVWAYMYFAKIELNTFFQTFPLKTSRQPATDLYKLMDQYVPDDLSSLRLNNDDGSTRMLLAYEVGMITTAAKAFETVLKAELGSWDSLFISQKGAYNTAELLERGEVMVPDVGRSIMPQKAVDDFRQAGMCMAFNLGTAAAFHAARATESVIKVYYEKVVGALPDVKARNWGAYKRNLEKCKRSDAKVLGWFGQLTTEYRNPILHPDEFLTPDAALEFIYACISLISSIGRAMEKLQLDDDGKAKLGSVDAQDTPRLESGTTEAA